MNGDLFEPGDLERARAQTGADALMVARGALWNTSIFGGEQRMLPVWSVCRRYVELAQRLDHSVAGTKYVVQQMLTGPKPGRRTRQAKKFYGRINSMRSHEAFL